jgi:hypothetical protein
MRTKFNKTENTFIVEALKEHIKKKENEINNKKINYGKGYFEIVGNEIINRVNLLTLKKHLKNR